MDVPTYPYKFSIIMAVYNVEDYLKEAVDSLLNQTIGFSKNVQLILVNDGSTDGSGAICDDYQTAYPDNITVIHKENGGVSSTRNAGIPSATGQYINFLDSDDKLSPNTLAKVYHFFEQHKGEIDVVAIPMVTFEASNKPHILNTKFTEQNRIVSLHEEHQAILLSTQSAFFTAEAGAHIHFDVNLIHAEDAKEVIKVLIQKMQYGLVSDCTYYYRKRLGANLSASQTAHYKKTSYNDYLDNFSLAVYQYCNDKIGYVPLFVQYTCWYHLQWTIKMEQFPPNLLTSEEKEQYFAKIDELLSQTYAKIITGQNYMYREHKHFLLLRKFGSEHFPAIELLKESRATCEFLSISPSGLKLEFNVSMHPSLYQDTTIYVRTSSKTLLPAVVKGSKSHTALGITVLEQATCEVDIALKSTDTTCSLEVLLQHPKSGLVRLGDLRFGDFMPIGLDSQHGYFFAHGWKAVAAKTGIYLSRKGRLNHMLSEARYLLGLLCDPNSAAKKAFVFRSTRHLLKPFFRKDVWIISDRVDKADDNGEALFRYLGANKVKGINYMFAISKEAPDYMRLKQYGKVIDLGKFSIRYKLHALMGATAISSHADYGVHARPFAWAVCYVRDLMQDFRFVFLQHGVTKDDVSHWLGKQNMDFSLLIAATKPEYQAFLSTGYGYTTQQVKLTGFPRYDLLYNQPEKIITIIPTWRKYLTVIDPTKNQSGITNAFVKSEFFQFYNALLSDERLLEKAKSLGYRIYFLPHPNFKNSLHLFDKPEQVSFWGSDANYRDVFAKSDMIVTDYSSVAFDFAYLRKPLIYAHFDAKDIFQGEHIGKQGYFSYEDDGFGEVTDSLDSTVSEVISYMDNNCALKETYKNRIEQTFAFSDKDSSQRVYETILSMTHHQ